MAKKITKAIKTTVYEVNSPYYKDFYMDIVETETVYRAYIWNENIGEKKLVSTYGKWIPKADFTHNVWCDLMRTRLLAKYMEEYHWKPLEIMDMQRNFEEDEEE